MSAKYFKLILLLLFTHAVFSQELSENNIFEIREIQGLLVTNPEKALGEAEKIAASENEIFSLLGRYYIANYHYNKSDYETAKKDLVTLLDYIEKSGKTASNKRYVDLKAMCLNKLFYLHKNLGDYEHALYYLDQYKDGIPEGRFDEHYGIAKVALGDYVRGIAMLKEAVATSPHLKLGKGEKKAMNDKLFADKYNTIGEAYQKYYIRAKKQTFLDSAGFYFDKAANLMLADNFEVAYTQALLYMHKADNARLSGDYKEALKLYAKGRASKIINKNIRTVQLFDLGMADCYFHLNQYESAISYAKRYEKNYAITKISKENLLIAYTILSKCYDSLKNTKSAYAYATKSLELIESIDKIKNKSLDFVHNYDVTKIKSESKALLSEKRYFKGGLLGIFLILMAVAFSFYYYSRQQKKKHQRFLQIIKRSKEKPVPADTFMANDLHPAKPSLDEEFIFKTDLGLKKLKEKEAYLKPNFKLDFVAKKLNTNTAYLSQYFNQVMQKSFSEYTQELRINYVLRKLNESPTYRNYTMQAIAEEVGYKDATSFVRVFKKQTGLSPSYYIEELKK